MDIFFFGNMDISISECFISNLVFNFIDYCSISRVCWLSSYIHNRENFFMITSNGTADRDTKKKKNGNIKTFSFRHRTLFKMIKNKFATFFSSSVFFVIVEHFLISIFFLLRFSFLVLQFFLYNKTVFFFLFLFRRERVSDAVQFYSF